MVDLTGHHLWKEKAQQAYKALNIFFACEEDFLARDCGFPKLSQCVSLVLIQNTLVEHQAFSNRVLKVDYVLLSVVHVRVDLASGVLTVNEQLDG